MQKYLMVQLNLEENRPIERSMLAHSLAKSLANSAFSRPWSSDCLAWRSAAFDGHLLSFSSESNWPTRDIFRVLESAQIPLSAPFLVSKYPRVKEKELALAPHWLGCQTPFRHLLPNVTVATFPTLYTSVISSIKWE